MQAAEWRDIATHAFAGMMMDRYDLPGFPERDPASVVAENSGPPADGAATDAVTNAPASCAGT